MAKAIIPLNDTKIKNAKPQDKEYRLSDGDNLFLIVKPNGSKLWRFMYSINGTRPKISIGKYPAVTLKQAREKRLKYQSLLEQGIDPRNHKINTPAIPTIKEFIKEWFQFWKVTVKDKTANDEFSRLKFHLLPMFGEYKLNELSLFETVQAFEPLYKSKPDTAIKIMRKLIQILDYAQIKGIIEHNNLIPLTKAYRPVQAKNQPTLSPDKLPYFLKRLWLSNCRVETKYLIMWQLLTMVRPNEAVSVEWSEIDFKKSLWVIPAEKMKGRKDKTKPHNVPLNKQALEILREIKNHTGNRKYVFNSFINPLKPMNNQTANNTIKHLDNGYFKGFLTAHGLRSIASTYLHGLAEFEPHLIEACLSHVVGNEVQRAYNRGDYLDARRPIMDKWGDFVEQCKYSR